MPRPSEQTNRRRSVPRPTPTRDEVADTVARAFPGAEVVHPHNHGRSRPPASAPSAAPDDDLTANLNFATPAAGGIGDQLVNKLLALRPMGTVLVEGSVGRPREATSCYVLEVAEGPDEDRGYVDHGALPIPWEKVREELATASPETPWIVGRLVRRKVAYFLNPPTPEQAGLARAALIEWRNDRRG